MTNQEQKEVIRVCGPDYKESDIPSYLRNRDARIEEHKEKGLLTNEEAERLLVEEQLAEEFRQEEN